MELFWARVDKSNIGGCWPWVARRTKQGYGVVVQQRKARPAHCVAWELANGKPIPEGLWGLHRCDNPPCVRPEHVYPGTPAQNTEDMMRRGRANPAHGQREPSACFRDDEIADITKRFFESGMTQKDFAKLIGVGQSTLGRVVRGDTYSHIKRAS